jgi:aminoglycoside 6-adenylyltransferase
VRDFNDIRLLILAQAAADERILAVLLNGSRANPDIDPDPFQDYDITYIVTELDSFISDHSWTNIFGEKIIWQLPDEMTVGEKSDISFSYLMLFKEGYRIDLTLFPMDKLKTHFKKDSLTVVWLDKGNLFSDIRESSDRDYWIKKPSEKEFLDTCNEFWWVSTYVAKGLMRHEITYVKEMMDTVVRPMMMKVIAWHIGFHHDFKVSFGVAGKQMHRYLKPALYQKILSTYAGNHINQNWLALFDMTEIFSELSSFVADRLKFSIDLNQGKKHNRIPEKL